jgi:hypothetical protein
VRLSKVSHDGQDGRLAPGILLQGAIVAVGDSVTVWRALSPIQFNELLGDGADRKVEFAALVASELDGEIGNGHEQCIFIGGDKLTLRQKSLDLAQEHNLFFSRSLPILSSCGAMVFDQRG